MSVVTPYFFGSVCVSISSLDIDIEIILWLFPTIMHGVANWSQICFSFIVNGRNCFFYKLTIFFFSSTKNCDSFNWYTESMPRAKYQTLTWNIDMWHVRAVYRRDWKQCQSIKYVFIFYAELGPSMRCVDFWCLIFPMTSEAAEHWARSNYK